MDRAERSKRRTLDQLLLIKPKMLPDVNGVTEHYAVSEEWLQEPGCPLLLDDPGLVILTPTYACFD